jgi:hypothetical protein
MSQQPGDVRFFKDAGIPGVFWLLMTRWYGDSATTAEPAKIAGLVSALGVEPITY